MAENGGIELLVNVDYLLKQVNNAINDINSSSKLNKIKVGIDTSKIDSAVDKLKTEIASISKNDLKINLGLDSKDLGKLVSKASDDKSSVSILSEESAKAQVTNMDAMVKTFMKDFGIVGKTSEKTAKEIKEEFQSAFKDIFDAKAVGDVDKVASGFEHLIELAREFSRVYKDDVSVDLYKDYRQFFKDNPVYIDNDVKANLKAIYGNGKMKDVRQMLNKAFGSKGWYYSKTDSDTWFSENQMFENIRDEANTSTDAVERLMNMMFSLKRGAEETADGFDLGKFSKQDIEGFVDYCYELIESRKKQAESADTVIKQENQVVEAIQREAKAFQDYQTVLGKFEDLSDRGLGKILNTSPSDYMMDFAGDKEAIDALGNVFDRISGMSKSDADYSLENLVKILDTFRDNIDGMSYEQIEKETKNVIAEINSIGAATDTVTESEKKNTQTVEKQTAAIKEQTEALKENRDASKIRNTVTASGDTSTSVTYGDSSKNSTINYKNGVFDSRTDVENFAQQKKDMDKLAATAANLRGELERAKNAYSDMNAPVQIKDEHIAVLDKEYESILNHINELEKSTSQYNEKAKAEINAQIASLKQMAQLYREANKAGSSMRVRDVDTVKDISTNLLKTFTSNISDTRVYSAVKGEIDELSKALDNVTDRAKLNEFLNQFDVLKAKVNSLTAEFKSTDSAMNELQKGMDSLNRISNNTTLYKNKGVDEVKELFSHVEKLKNSYQDLMNRLKSDDSAENVAKIKDEMAELKDQIKETIQEADTLAKTFRNTGYDQKNITRVEQLKAKIEAFKKANSRGLDIVNPNTGIKFGDELDNIIAKLPDAQAKGEAFIKMLEDGFKTIDVQMEAADAKGKSFWEEMGEKAIKFIKWTGMTFSVTEINQYLEQMVKTVYDLDTELIDLKKTFNGTDKELNQFYFDANKLAKQMGVTTAEIIKQGAAWSRLGYSSNATMKKMAEMSAMFSAISPDMDTEQAQNGLVSIMKAFDIDPENVLDGILSKVNIIGNTAATSNGEIVEMLEKSSSAMKEANNTLEQTIALETAAVEITRDASSVGNAFKTNYCLYVQKCA